jgi:hypothetical protein
MEADCRKAPMSNSGATLTFTSYDLAGVLKQHRQELEGLFLKGNSQAVLAQSSMERNPVGKGVYHQVKSSGT